ncbi:MAG: hypothetical protein ABI175_00390 [Polyangiales bacterium]
MGSTIDGTSSSAASYKIEEPKTEGPPNEAPRTLSQKTAAWAEAATSCTGLAMVPFAGTAASFYKEVANGSSWSDAAKRALVKNGSEVGIKVGLHFLGPVGEAASEAVEVGACVEATTEALTGKKSAPPTASPDGSAPKTAEAASAVIDGNVTKKVVANTTAAAEKIIEEAMAKLGRKS